MVVAAKDGTITDQKSKDIKADYTKLYGKTYFSSTRDAANQIIEELPE